MSNGFFSIAGVQSGGPSGGQAYLGPYALDFGTALDVQQVVVNTTATIAVPSGSLGVCVIPPIGNTSPTLEWSTVSTANAASNYINPGQPSLWEWDPAHIPSNVYLVSGGSVSVQVQFL